MKAGLLKRLTGDAPSQEPDAQTLAVFIAAHLADLLNIRVGSCESRDDLGLPVISPVQLQGDETQSLRLAQVIQLQVEHFEPRLYQVSVVSAGEKKALMTFELSAEFERIYERWQVQYRIQIDNDSQVAVFCTGLQRGGAVRRL